MDIDVLNQELSERINNLQTDLDNCKRQKEVITIIRSLKSFVPRQGYETVMNTRSISQDAFNTFISLLNSSEYIRGFSNARGGSSTRLESRKYDQYFLTLGEGIILIVNFCETEIKEHEGSSIKYDLTVRAYVDFHDLCVETISEPGWPDPVIVIRKQDGSRVYDTNTTYESLTLNGQRQKLNEVLIPISPDDLAKRYFDMMENLYEKGMKQ